jgi:hypothetical protein
VSCLGWTSNCSPSRAAFSNTDTKCVINQATYCLGAAGAGLHRKISHLFDQMSES